MWIVKSLALGLLAVLAALSVCIVVLILTAIAFASSDGGGIGWDPVSLMHQQPLIPLLFVAIILLVFAIGFAEGYRRFHLRTATR